MVKIYNPAGEIMSPEMLAEWANRVHNEVGKAKGHPFTPELFDGLHEGYRLAGDMCNCGCEDTPPHSSLGVWDLLPIESPDVQGGMKAYMQCRRCGCYSHL